MNLTKKEIEVLQQILINEEIATSKKINELETIKVDQDRLGLNNYIKVIVEDKKEYHKLLDNIERKLRDELKK